MHVFFCSTLILIISSITIPERVAKYILAGIFKKYTVIVHKRVFAYKLAISVISLG